MALGNNIPSSSIRPTTGAPVNNAGLRNINSNVKGGISEFADSISANVDPSKPISSSQLESILKNSADGLPSLIKDALASLAPIETAHKDSTVDAKAKQATAETHAKFAFNLPGQGRQEQAKEQNQDFLKNLSGNDWMNTGASLT
jgi:predicted AAA+ superfamily ATPase